MLVVDDSELLHKMYDLVLRRYATHGTKVIHAYDGAEALALLGRHADVDLILLDVNMPNMNGIEFLRRRQPDAMLARVPVIVISTEGKEHDARLALSEGAADYLTKPFEASTLHQKIDLVLKREGAGHVHG
jgi:CheY-like chemotaxis protein